MSQSLKLLEELRALETLRLKEQLQQESIQAVKGIRPELIQSGQLVVNTHLLFSLQRTDKALTTRYGVTSNQFLLLKADIDPKNRPVVAWLRGNEIEPYEIKAHERYGLSCNCGSWKFNRRGDRTCKHTDRVSNQVVVI